MHDDQEFSNQSIINVIEKFVRSVNSMEETILVPSRLMDRQVNLICFIFSRSLSLSRNIKTSYF